MISLVLCPRLPAIGLLHYSRQGPWASRECRGGALLQPERREVCSASPKPGVFDGRTGWREGDGVPP